MKERKYILLILLHVVIAVLIFLVRPLSVVYAICIPAVGLYYVMKSQNRNNEVLFVAAYIVGSEVLLRMTEGNPVYEFSKYGVMIFILIGIYYSGISKHAIAYWIFLLLLVPGIVIAAFVFIIINFVFSLNHI